MSRTRLAPLLGKLGVLAILLGVAVWRGAFRWFGHLPGDINAVRDGVQIYVPFTSLVVLALLLGIILAVVGRWVGR
ncbi:MAG: DUF2905 family protein [Gemmatimonadota bacterium]